MHVSLLGYGEMFTVLMKFIQFGDFIAALFQICDPLYEILCFVTICYFVHYIWDCWCSFKFRSLHTMLGYSTMFIFALLGILQCLTAP